MDEQQKELLKQATAKKYVIFETGVRQELTLTDFKIVKLDKPDQYGREYQFKAKVICKDGTDKELNQSSSRFIEAIAPFIEDENPKDLITLRLKKIGDGTDTQYDIEELSKAV